MHVTVDTYISWSYICKRVLAKFNYFLLVHWSRRFKFNLATVAKQMNHWGVVYLGFWDPSHLLQPTNGVFFIISGKRWLANCRPFWLKSILTLTEDFLFRIKQSDSSEESKAFCGPMYSCTWLKTVKVRTIKFRPFYIN